MLLPLSTGESVADSDDAAITQLRNPLIEPRILDEDTRHRREGEQIAAQIRQLLIPVPRSRRTTAYARSATATS